MKSRIRVHAPFPLLRRSITAIYECDGIRLVPDLTWRRHDFDHYRAVPNSDIQMVSVDAICGISCGHID
jgi:hypothetical protein